MSNEFCFGRAKNFFSKTSVERPSHHEVSRDLSTYAYASELRLSQLTPSPTLQGENLERTSKLNSNMLYPARSSLRKAQHAISVNSLRSLTGGQAASPAMFCIDAVSIPRRSFSLRPQSSDEIVSQSQMI